MLPAPVKLSALAFDPDAPAALLIASAPIAMNASEMVIFLVKPVPPLSFGCVVPRMPGLARVVG